MINVLIYIFPAALLLAAVSDIARYEIPNWVSIVLAAAYPAVALLGGVPVTQIGYHVATGALVFGGGAVLFYFRAFGGGDVKLLAASAIWVGWHNLLPFLLVVALAGGAITLLLLVARLLNRALGKSSGPPEAADAAWHVRLLSPERGIPYGVAIGLGGLMVFPSIRGQLGLVVGI